MGSIFEAGGTNCESLELDAGGTLAVSPEVKSNFEVDRANCEPEELDVKGTVSDTVTVYFWDCTGKRSVKTVLEFTESEWYDLRVTLREIRASTDSIEESFNAQFEVFKDYGLISDDISYGTLEDIAMERFEGKQHRPPRESQLENVIINAMCAINFELDSCNTFVFGLNTFVNIIGFDIISFHNGHTPDGIETKGILEQNADPGDYFGSMFGFLGYWAGTRTGTGTYSDLVVAGFTIFTTWIPLPS